MEYNLSMKWKVILDDELIQWLLQQDKLLRSEISSKILLLETYGPALPRPFVDSIKGSSVKNLKELRIQYQGDPFRVLFAFDPVRRAILLVAGNKRGDKRWYEKMIPIAEKRFQKHLKSLEKKND